MSMNKENVSEESSTNNKMSFWHLVLTSMAAAIGVQSKKNLEKDFSQQSPLPFIIAGIVFTILFMGSIIFVVKLVLSDV